MKETMGLKILIISVMTFTIFNAAVFLMIKSLVTLLFTVIGLTVLIHLYYKFYSKK